MDEASEEEEEEEIDDTPTMKEIRFIPEDKTQCRFSIQLCFILG